MRKEKVIGNISRRFNTERDAGKKKRKEKRGGDERQEEIECKEREEGWMKGGEEGGSKEGRRIESG